MEKKYAKAEQKENAEVNVEDIRARTKGGSTRSRPSQRPKQVIRNDFT